MPDVIPDSFRFSNIAYHIRSQANLSAHEQASHASMADEFKPDQSPRRVGLAFFFEET